MANIYLEMLGTQFDGMQAEINRLRATVDKLLAHCGDPECMECGAAVCPWGEPLHFHHDGCPACCQDDD